MAYPKLVAFDLDGTVWSNWLDPNAFGRRGKVGINLEDNLNLVGNVINDKLNPSQQVKVSGHISWIVYDLYARGVKVAITSRNSNRNLCVRAIWLIKMQIPAGSNWRPFNDFLSYTEIYDMSKQVHFQRMNEWSHIDFHEMLYFDDQTRNNEVEMWQGATFYKVSNGNQGITQADYLAGLDIWRRNQLIRRPMPGAGPNPLPNIRQIGWVGTDWATGERYRQGKRRTKSDRPSRWGWGLYVADDPSIAAQFAKWLREHQPDNQYICRVFARDFEVFRSMNKVWVPENGSVPQTDINLGEEHIANIQCQRDDIIASNYGVRKPYILFSRHHWMDLLAMTWRKNHVGRFSEMVLYPQVQDALFYGQPWKLSDAQAWLDRNALEGYGFRRNLRAWNIQYNWETQNCFTAHRENFE